MSENVTWHGGIEREARWKALATKGATLWFTGLSGSGKSTVACALEAALIQDQKIFSYRLDGDNMRMGLNKDLEFSPADREENIRRVAEVAALFADSGTVVLASFVSPYRKDREKARAVHQARGLSFYEIYLQTSLEACEQRDPKGLYKQARSGQLKGMTGLDAPYEEPLQADLVLDTEKLSVDESVQACLKLLAKRG